MSASRSTGATPLEGMTAPGAGRVARQETAAQSAWRVAPASGGTPARSDRRPAAAGVCTGGGAPTTGAAKSGCPAAATVRTSGGPASTGAAKSRSSTAATPREGGQAASAPVTLTGATKSSGAASAAARGKAVRWSSPAGGATPRRESSAVGSQATKPPPAPRRSRSTAGSASAFRASSAAGRSAKEVAAAPATAAAQVLLPLSRPGTPLVAAAAATATPVDGWDDLLEQESPPRFRDGCARRQWKKPGPRGWSWGRVSGGDPRGPPFSWKSVACGPCTRPFRCRSRARSGSGG